MASRPLGWLRAGFGYLVAFWLLSCLADGYVTRELGAALFHFHFYALEWVRPIGTTSLIVLFSGLALCAVAGIRLRAAQVLLTVGLVYVLLVEESLYTNELYLACLLAGVLAACDPGRKLPRWGHTLLRLLVVVPLFYGGVSMLASDWIHGEPLGFALRRQGLGSGAAPALAKAWALLQLAVIPALAWRRSRYFAIGVLAVLATAGAWLFAKGALAFVPVAGAAAFLIEREDTSPDERPAVRVAAGAFALLQLLLPLRAWLAPGPPAWHEQGAHFSWLAPRQKDGLIRVRATAPGARKELHLNPSTFLTPHQLAQMKRSPGRIHQFARFAAALLGHARHTRARVEIDALVSLNGREAEEIIDPGTDLGSEPLSFGYGEPWIRALTKPLDIEAPAQESAATGHFLASDFE